MHVQLPLVLIRVDTAGCVMRTFCVALDNFVLSGGGGGGVRVRVRVRHVCDV